MNECSDCFPILLSIVMATSSNAMLQQIRGSLATLSRDAREARMQHERERRCLRGVARVWVITGEDAKAALVMYCCCNYDPSAAARFLHTIGQRRRWPEMSDMELRRLVEELFLEADLSDLAMYLDEHVPDRIRAIVDRWVQEWKLVTWIRDANTMHGVAPSGCTILTKAKQICRLPACALGANQRGLPNEQARTWLSRLRKRWNCRVGRVRHVEQISKTEAQAKASTCWHARVHVSVSITS